MTSPTSLPARGLGKVGAVIVLARRDGRPAGGHRNDQPFVSIEHPQIDGKWTCSGEVRG